ncbi:RNA polymerase factor sigma-54, partial [Salinimicrobium oceani]|nr:RNA polymerase sigma-54 factor [Salinimicrobium oceani]
MLKQQLNFKLSQKLSPQQIQLMKLIQLPTQAFEQRLKQEMEENPALEGGKEEKDEYEEDYNQDEYQDDDPGNETIEADIDVDEYLSDDEIPSYRLQANNYSADDEDRQVPYASGTSFTQYLKTQLSTLRLNESEKEIAEFLVGSVDESGYIRRSIQDIVDDLAFTQNVYTDEPTVEKVLKHVHELDPAGVGARNLQECLLIQLARKEQTRQVSLARDIIESSFDQFS